MTLGFRQLLFLENLHITEQEPFYQWLEKMSKCSHLKTWTVKRIPFDSCNPSKLEQENYNLQKTKYTKEYGLFQ